MNIQRFMSVKEFFTEMDKLFQEHFEKEVKNGFSEIESYEFSVKKESLLHYYYTGEDKDSWK